MLFIGFALLIAVGLALLISADAGSLIGLTEQQTASLVPLLILLVVFAAAAFSRRRRMWEMVGHLGVWLVLFGVVMLGYTYRDDIGNVAARVYGELMPGVAIVDENRGTVTFRAGRGGHFQINAKINGADVPTIFDTGASAVVLTAEDARRAGIDTGALRFDVPVATANGTGRAASVVLDRVVVGGIVRQDIRAFVAEDGALDTSLLGMSFLETLNRYGVSANSLELVD
jgi:aspartyl protease family protein